MAKKKTKWFHTIQGISLIAAIAFLWIPPYGNHKTMMLVASAIIGINALLELFN